LVDDLDEEIDELEDIVETQPADRTRARISTLRHDLLHVRRTLTPMRDAVRRVIDNTVEVEEGTEVFDNEVEVSFNAAYDKFLRASDGLDLARDLLSGVRDYSQAKIANDQNEVMKRLTVVASLLLLPTFIVGLYGQNFVNIPELKWHFGYAFSWGVIVGRTILQLWFFRWKKWVGAAARLAACRISSARTAKSARSTATASKGSTTRPSPAIAAASGSFSS